jgi:hypothetical protein
MTVTEPQAGLQGELRQSPWRGRAGAPLPAMLTQTR